MNRTRALMGPGSVHPGGSRYARSHREPRTSPPIRALAVIVAFFSLTWCGATRAGDNPSPPFSARTGLDVAVNAAHSWATDAQLVYVENDEVVGPDGNAGRWGYLFYSENRGRARGYSIRDGKLDEAADLDFELDAPPVSNTWVDSNVALMAAEQKAGTKYCIENNGRLATMLLIRGAFHEQTPNATTWAVVYTSPAAPALFVVVDATRGDVVRMWRG